MRSPSTKRRKLCCGSHEYTESFKYLSLQLTSNRSDSTDTDAQLSRGRRAAFTSSSKVFCSTTLSVKLCMKLLQTLITPIVFHGCECWTLSRALCDKLNVFQMRCLRTIGLLHVRWKDGWRGGLVVGRRTCDLRVAGSRPGRDAAAQQP